MISTKLDLPELSAPDTQPNVPLWTGLADEVLASVTYDLFETIADRDAAHRFATEQMRSEYQAMCAELIRRIRERGGYAIAHPSLRVEVDVKDVLQKRIDVLRRLADFVPEDELRSALSLVQPEPHWQADGNKLRALARKYGGKIAEIVNAGLHRVPIGPPRLVLGPKNAGKSPLSHSQNHTQLIPLRGVNDADLTANAS